MIRALDFGTAISDEGFRIKRRYKHIIYKEGDYALHIAEYQADESIPPTKQDPYILIIDFDLMTGWFPPHREEVINEKKKQQIILRVEAAMKVLMAEDPLRDYQVQRQGNKLVISGKKRPFQAGLEHWYDEAERTANIFRHMEEISKNKGKTS